MLSTLNNISEATNKVVYLDPELSFLPVIRAQNGKSVPLYEFVEVLDGLLDYEEIKKELPDLSYAQISGAIGFLRKLGQFNTVGVDIDQLEDDDDALRAMILIAMRDTEAARVLTAE